jgi:hypothetical protein
MLASPTKHWSFPKSFGMPCDRLYLITLAVASGVCGMRSRQSAPPQGRRAFSHDYVWNIRDQAIRWFAMLYTHEPHTSRMGERVPRRKTVVHEPGIRRSENPICWHLDPIGVNDHAILRPINPGAD